MVVVGRGMGCVVLWLPALLAGGLYYGTTGLAPAWRRPLLAAAFLVSGAVIWVTGRKLNGRPILPWRLPESSDLPSEPPPLRWSFGPTWGDSLGEDEDEGEGEEVPLQHVCYIAIEWFALGCLLAAAGVWLYAFR